MNQATAQKILILFVLAATSALIFAYSAQYIFGLQPCILCLYQRYPFWLIIILAAPFLLFRQLRIYQNIAVLAATLLITANIIIAFYHNGVEQHIFPGPSSCAAAGMNAQTVAELKAALANSKAVRCDTPSWYFLGLSMTAWNFIYCLMLLGAAFCLYRRDQQKK